MQHSILCFNLCVLPIRIRGMERMNPAMAHTRVRDAFFRYFPLLQQKVAIKANKAYLVVDGKDYVKETDKVII